MARSVINFNNNNLTKKKNCTSHVYQQTLAYRIKHAKKKKSCNSYLHMKIRDRRVVASMCVKST